MPKTTKWFGDFIQGILRDRMPLMIVTKIENLSSNLKKISFQGNIATMDYQPGYAVAIRVSESEFRNYSVSRYNKNSGVIELIFHIHGTAAGTNLIDSLCRGDQLRISMPRGKRLYDPFFEKYLFFGDETALGAAIAFQAEIDKNYSIKFYFELDDVNKNIPADLGLRNVTVFQKHYTFRSPELIAALPLFRQTNWQSYTFVLTGNSHSIKAFRRILKINGFSGRSFSQGYWMEGVKGL